jgi:hypothetical protein
LVSYPLHVAFRHYKDIDNFELAEEIVSDVR